MAWQVKYTDLKPKHQRHRYYSSSVSVVSSWADTHVYIIMSSFVTLQ